MTKIKKLIVPVFLSAILCFTLAGCDMNYDYEDPNYGYDYAYILMPNGDIVEGTVDGCDHYAYGYLHVTINGVTYMTDTTRVVIVHHEKEETE